MSADLTLNRACELAQEALTEMNLASDAEKLAVIKSSTATDKYNEANAVRRALFMESVMNAYDDDNEEWMRILEKVVTLHDMGLDVPMIEPLDHYGEELYGDEESDEEEESDEGEHRLDGKECTFEGDIYSLAPKDFVGTAHNGRRCEKARNDWGGCYMFKNGKPMFWNENKNANSGVAPKASEFKIDNGKLYYRGSGGKWTCYIQDEFSEGNESS
jgi:hypothetical protein